MKCAAAMLFLALTGAPFAIATRTEGVAVNGRR
jgi:hypothetical protein